MLIAVGVHFRRFIGDVGELLFKFRVTFEPSHPRVRHRYLPQVNQSKTERATLQKDAAS
ncbi:hypothetical protein J5277_29820 [Rhizobium sp. 16-449-1b]|uniref:hypothetical protein n=1 Tax=Rhizobium sp. 16-449-1b TaxID=2819989 RepID=UPI001ADAEC7E|nr:hypothetical protein [Rhizobium sp. 16-449-1b]MBO9198327.1 hypothetical protein [Rhizobium sp. 16-449-1b]